MTSGACRALVALLLTLVATIGLTLPAAAATDRLNETSLVTYMVDPGTGNIDVDIIFRLSPSANRPFPGEEWGPIVIESRATPRVNLRGETRFEELPGPWRALYVTLPRIDAGGQLAFRVQYTLAGSIRQQAARLEDMPARVDAGYIYVCVPGQDTDSGLVELKIASSGAFEVDQSGSVLSPTDNGLESESLRDPKTLFTCVEATRENRMGEPTTFPGPDDRAMVIQPWRDSPDGWSFGVEQNGERALDSIREFLGHEIPGEGPVILRQAPERGIGGYASAHDTPGIVQVDERGGTEDPEHEFAHAWFGKDNVLELWLREGLAEWIATSIQGAECAPATSSDANVQLTDWQVVKPFSDPDTIDADIAAQQAASCGVISAMTERMSAEQWNEVLGSMLKSETKYIGTRGPTPDGEAVVDYREFLDAVDERGLIPAAKTDPAFAANREELDFAQNLLDAVGADVDPALLAERSAARAAYHDFLDEAAPLGAPLAVREAMDSWEFRRATEALTKSYEVLGAIRDADAKLPTAGLIPFIQPSFEGARTEAALDDVLEQAETLNENVAAVAGPLEELVLAAPASWSMPTVINEAVTAQQFDLIGAAITPAKRVVESLVAADRFLPQAGLLEAYQQRYETTGSVEGLEELATEASAVRADADRTSVALADLEGSVGEWQIPAAVTDPITNGQIAAAAAIVGDARAVVNAARDADIALPDAEISAEIRPRFEAVVTGADMATLKVDAEKQRTQAESIGDALSSLRSEAPDWDVPEVVEAPIRERDFTTAAEVAEVAQDWIVAAAAANEKLPSPIAFAESKADFEAAESLADLQEGASRAANWNSAAAQVARAQTANDQDRDLLESLGLIGVDVTPALEEAIAAAISGDVQLALDRSTEVIDTLNSASSSGGLRLAGIVFMGVAILGVLGLWLMLRREAGPPWARHTTPHWVDKKPSRWRGGGGGDDKKGK
jgi:hypothetical protein